MPHDIATKRIYREVIGNVTYGVDALGDVAPVLGSISGAWSVLCTHGMINKWARFKPMRWREFDSTTQQYSPCERPLLDAEFKGDRNDQANGIYFGLQRAAASPVTGTISTWPNMHGITYTYQQPRGLATYQEMYRILDFASWEHPKTSSAEGLGYNGKAVPNPSAELWAEIGYYNGTINGISAGYYDTNDEGVDLVEIFKDPTESLNAVLATTFPCILITDENGHSYFTALDSDVESGPTPLYYNSAYHRGPWSVDMVKELMQGGSSQGQPWTSTQRYMHATLFMLRVPSSYVDGDGYPHLTIAATDPNNLKSLASWWFDCADQQIGEIIMPFAPVPFPNAINNNLSLFLNWTGVSIKANSVAFSDPLQGFGNRKVTIDFTKQVSSGGPFTYSADVIVEYDGQHQVTKTITGSSSDQTVPSVEINSQEFDGALWYEPGKDLIVTVRTTGSWSQGMNVTTARFTVPPLN